MLADTKQLVLDISETDWEANGDEFEDGEPWHRLTGPKLCVAGYTLHFEAWAVRESDNGYEAVNPALSDDVEALYAIYPAPLEPIVINGRDYFLCAFPSA